MVKIATYFTSEQVRQFNYETKTKFDNLYYMKEGDYYIICYKNNKKYEVIVDEDFFDFLKAHNRRLQLDSRGYAFITRRDEHKQLFVHNLVIFGFDYYDKNMDINVDHINSENYRDNRKSNLRPANDFENTQNAKRRKDNTCGIKGFTISIPKNRPTAHIVVKIQSYKTRISKSFTLSPSGLKEAITWSYNERLSLHEEFANFGFEVQDKSLDDIINEQSNIFISTLNDRQLHIFNNDGYVYKPIKNKPRRNVIQ